jgi:hypothetical protein
MIPIRGLACFRFLNRFTYGNFGAPERFGLESGLKISRGEALTPGPSPKGSPGFISAW